MASINMASFYNDPVYRRLAMEAQRPETSQGEQSASMSEGDSSDPFADTGGISPNRASTFSPVSAQTTMSEPVYGTTPDEGLLKRGEQGIAANIRPILQSIALGDTAPLKSAAIGAGVQSFLGDRPSYLEQTKKGGFRTQIGGFQAGQSYTQLGTGAIEAYDPLTEQYDGAMADRTLTAAQAARLSPMDYVGADPRKPGGTIGQALQTLASPPLLALMFGKTVESPIGTPVALGSAGFLSERIHDAMFDFQAGVNENKPGYFAMQIGNRYSAYNANADMFDINVAGMNLNRQQFERIYGAGMGKDYRYVDWKNSTAGDLKGPSLIGFTDQGGFTEAGEFMTPSGAVMTGLNSKQMRDYVSALPNDPTILAQVSGVMAANARTAKSKYQRSLMAKNAARLAELARGASRTEYAQGLAMRTPEEIAYGRFAFESSPEDGGSVATVEGYTTVSGREESESDGNTYNFNQPDASDVYFAEGGRVNKAVGMMAGEEQPQPEEMGPVGFVNGKTPKEAGEAATVRDDVEGTVPEGTFVISGASVEKYGSERIRKLLVSALREAQVQGIDISSTDSKIVDEESVSVAVSEGEVLIPPVLVRIIGLQKLEKINALGQEEVTERVEEYGQAEASEPVEGEAQVMASVDGGFIERQKKPRGV